MQCTSIFGSIMWIRDRLVNINEKWCILNYSENKHISLIKIRLEQYILIE